MKKSLTPSQDPNKDAILEVLLTTIPQHGGRLLEIGSGKGEYGLYFAAHMKKLHWVMSEHKSRCRRMSKALSAKYPNLHGPEVFNVGEDDFPGKKHFDYVFTANTLHTLSWKQSKTLFKLLARRLREDALVFFYGPFKQAGEFLSEKHAQLDAQLKEKDPRAGLRNQEDIVNAMGKGGFRFLKAEAMPGEQQLLIFCRQAHQS